MRYNSKDLALSYRKVQDSSPSPGFRQTHKVERFRGTQKDAALTATYARRFTKEEQYAPTLAKQRQQRREALSKPQAGLASPANRGANVRRAALRAAFVEAGLVERPKARQASRSSSPASRSGTSSETAMLRTEDLSWRQPAAPPPSLAELARRLTTAAKNRLSTWRTGLAKWFSSRKKGA